MTTFEVTINWWALFFGFLIGMSVMGFLMFAVVYIIDKDCTCGAWKSENKVEV